MTAVVNIEKLRAMLAELYSDDGNQFLRSPQPYLGGDTPEQAILAGRLDEVEAHVQRVLDGVFV